MPVADASLVLSIGMFVLILPLLFLRMLLTAAFQDFGKAVAVVAGIWLCVLGYFVWRAGDPAEASPRIMDLRVFHVLPILMLVFVIPNFSERGHLDHMMGFLDFIILGALVIYGSLCFRLLVLPPKSYWFYLAINMTSLWILLSRI
jgi:hypothetical protein